MKQVLLSGIQPTGAMHLGNYFGAVQNWVHLQNEYQAYFMIADYHSLTSLYTDPSALRAAKRALVLDLFSVGIDPEKAVVFYQSDVPQHAELHLLLSMMTPLSWLERVPTYKGKQEQSEGHHLDTYGFLGYPLLQAADILLYQTHVVPVGRDQLPHLELTREVVRRFNHFYSTSFDEPEALLTHVPELPGLDGRKMSKSYGNTLSISEPADVLEKKVLKMMSDPQRVRRDDPGNPDQCPVFSYHRLLNTSKRAGDIDAECRSAKIGCFDCKKECASLMNALLEPFRQRRLELEASGDTLDTLLDNGGEMARQRASETLTVVRKAMGLD